MTNWLMFSNWVITGLLGVLFGTASGWVTYRYQRRQDDIRWEREKEHRREDWQREQEKMKQQWEQEQQKLRQQWEHEKDLRALQFDEQERARLREELIRGTDDPLKVIEELGRARMELRAAVSDEEHLYSRLRDETYDLMFIEIGKRKYMDSLAKRLVRETTLKMQLGGEILEQLIEDRRDRAFTVILVGMILMVVNLAAILILKQWIFSLILLAAPILIIIGIAALFLFPLYIRRKHDQ